MDYTCGVKVKKRQRKLGNQREEGVEQVNGQSVPPDIADDTGRTAASVHERLAALGCDMRMACVYWKPEKNVTQYKPDFHVRTLDRWIVFPHEIEGLTPEEIAEKDEVLAALMKIK